MKNQMSVSFYVGLFNSTFIDNLIRYINSLFIEMQMKLKCDVKKKYLAFFFKLWDYQMTISLRLIGFVESSEALRIIFFQYSNGKIYM